MDMPSDASCRAADLLTESGLWDIVLERLREEGFSQTESIEATAARLGCSLAEAKRIVHLSPAWSDVRPANDDLHQALEESARAGP